MSTSTLEKESALQDRLLKTRRVALEIKVGHNATPALKTHSTDLATAAILRSEGKTAEADAVEELDFTTAEDEEGIFGVLLKTGKVRKVVSSTITNLSGSATYALTHKLGEETIGIDIDSNADLSAASIDAQLVVEYIVE